MSGKNPTPKSESSRPNYERPNSNKNERKGVQASNLLSFRYEKGSSQNDRGLNQRSNHRKHRGNSISKEEYVHSHPLSNPFESCWYQTDVIIPWDLIESVIVSVNHENTMICAICLDLVQFPKITKCGHCFCFVCIIRHMKCDRSNRWKCPMCLENIFASDLKTVKYENTNTHLLPDPSIGETTTVTLKNSSTITQEEYERFYENNPNFKRALKSQRYRGQRKKPALNKQSKISEPKTSDQVEGDQKVGEISTELNNDEESDEECDSNKNQFMKFRHITVTKGNLSPQLLYLKTSFLTPSTTATSPHTKAAIPADCTLIDQLQLLHQAIPLEDSPESVYSRIMYRSVPAILNIHHREKTELLTLQREYQSHLYRFLQQYHPQPSSLSAQSIESLLLQAQGGSDDDDAYNPYREDWKAIQYLQYALEMIEQRHQKFLLGLGQFTYEEYLLTTVPMETIPVFPASPVLPALVDVPPTNTVINSNNGNNTIQSQVNTNNGGESLISSFYQSESGSYSFLHPLCQRCLLDYYASFPTHSLNITNEFATNNARNNENPSLPSSTVDTPQSQSSPPLFPYPEYILGKVLEIEKIRITSSLKQRYSFLRHLPLHLEIEFIEIDVRSLVNKSIYNKFQNEIMKRNSKRLEKKKLENIQMKLLEEKRVKEEVELQQRLAHYNEIQMKKGYVPATSSVPVSSGLSASDFPLAMAAANEISENQGETNGEDLLPPAIPESNFNYDGKISFSEITQLNGNFPALASPLPSFPTLYQSQTQAQGGKPSINPSIASHPGGWGKSAPLKSTNKERESEEVKAPSSPLTPIASASTPPKSQKNAKKPKVNLLSTASTRNYRG